jgi:hypothetical protein
MIRGREVDNSLTILPRISMYAWSYTSIPTIRPHGVVLRDRDNPIFAFAKILCEYPNEFNLR